MANCWSDSQNVNFVTARESGWFGTTTFVSNDRMDLNAVEEMSSQTRYSTMLHPVQCQLGHYHVQLSIQFKHMMMIWKGFGKSKSSLEIPSLSAWDTVRHSRFVAYLIGAITTAPLGQSFSQAKTRLLGPVTRSPANLKLAEQSSFRLRKWLTQRCGGNCPN